MNIEDLDNDYYDYISRPSYYQHHIGMFMQHTIDVLKDLQQQLNKKEDKIDVNNIKEVKNINGK